MRPAHHVSVGVVLACALGLVAHRVASPRPLASPAASPTASIPAYATNAGSPAVLGESADGTRLTFTFTRIADSSITYTVQASNNLTTPWTDIWSSTGAANTAGGITVPDTEDISASPKRFLRLKVSS